MGVSFNKKNTLEGIDLKTMGANMIIYTNLATKFYWF